MARLDVTPLLRGHWKGLTNRYYSHSHIKSQKGDYLSRGLTIFLPAATAIAAFYFNASLHISGDIGVFIGIALAWAALVAAGMLGVFPLLAGWREKVSAKGTVKRSQLDLLDEAGSHALLGVLDAVILGAISVVALFTSGYPLRISVSLILALWIHTLFIFYLASTRMYSAHTQADGVSSYLNGYDSVQTIDS